MKHLFILLILCPFLVIGQQKVNSSKTQKKDSKDKKSLEAKPKNEADFENDTLWNKVLNRSFLSILGAKTDNSSIGNFATFDPAAGSFKFKGSIAVGKQESKRLSYLSLSASGDLVSDSYAALFNNTKLNTNVAIQGEWHIPLGKRKFVVDEGDLAQYRLGLKILELKSQNRLDKDGNAVFSVNNKIQESRFQQEIISSQLIKKKALLDTIRKKTDLIFKARYSSDSSKAAWSDSLNKTVTAFDKLEKKFNELRFTIDSLQQIKDDANNILFSLDQKNEREFKAGKEALDLTIPLKRVNFHWLSLVAGTGKKNFYTYQPKLPFAQQINKIELVTWKYGVTWNYFRQDLLTDKIFYMNLGLVRMKDNNTGQLSTTDINQEFVFKNAAGDTTRKIAKKYTVFTDPVEEQILWNINANIYYLFGEKSSGIHVFPSLFIPNGKENYFNIGVGYVVSFLNTKKDEPAVNAELYFQFNDLSDSAQLENKFWDRNEIGLRFSLPFSRLLN